MKGVRKLASSLQSGTESEKYGLMNKGDGLSNATMKRLEFA